MADYLAIAAVGKSLERLLTACFEEEQPIENKKTKAVLVQTGDFDKNMVSQSIKPPALSIYLYRVDFNKAMRAAWSGVGSLTNKGILALDLHFLMTPWAENAEFEHRILGKAMQCLEARPIWSGPLLHNSSAWAPQEGVQIAMEEISTEALMRTFDSLPTDYRLSVAYVARVVRIETKPLQQPKPVMTVATGITVSSRP